MLKYIKKFLNWLISIDGLVGIDIVVFFLLIYLSEILRVANIDTIANVIFCIISGLTYFLLTLKICKRNEEEKYNRILWSCKFLSYLLIGICFLRECGIFIPMLDESGNFFMVSTSLVNPAVTITDTSWYAISTVNKRAAAISLFFMIISEIFNYKLKNLKLEKVEENKE